MSATHQEMRAFLDTDDLAGLFNLLGWDRPPEGSTAVLVPETDLEAELVALKLGVGVWRIDASGVPPRATQRRVASELSRHTAERLVVFVADGEQLWLWPEQSASGVGYRLVDHRYIRGHGNDGLLQRLAGAAFTLSEESGLTVLKVLERVRRSFNVDKVTKAFYREFKKHHDRLAQQVEGIDDDDKRHWYVSVLLNRLMFVYFVQRKGFLDDDPQYLRTRLGRVRHHYGRDDHQAFFSKFLLPLFHDALGSANPVYEDLAIREIIGHVPYVNGGIFELHPLEDAHSIAIKDTAIEEVLDFFDAYRWHLDERPSGEANEINPDVLGYIFEQYINQKQQGAYYTKTDVTGYMADMTILPVLVDRLLEAGVEDPLLLLSVDPDRYLPESMRHGVDRSPPEQARPGDRADETHGLPGECWAEALDRHGRYSRLRQHLADDAVQTVDEAVTANVALRPLLIDYLRIGDARETQRAYEVLSSLSICDPTCGSGAFLFAALDLLEELYQAVFDRAEELCAKEPQDIEVLRFLSRTEKSPSRRYSLLKTICLNNLYGVDLMPEAAEIARLRLFLKLAAQIDDPVKLEPLPDLDFNVKSGNLLVGMADLEDAASRFGHDAIAQSLIPEITSRARVAAHVYTEFVDSQKSDEDPDHAARLKANMQATLTEMRSELNEMLHTARVEQEDLDSWVRSHAPFHWFIEFPRVFTEGGFDVIIGNPPYIDRRKVTGYRWRGFETGDCSDIYAPCVERAAGLLKSRGRFAMILKHSISFSRDFQKLRDCLRLRFPEAWVSSYSRIPAGLFTNDTRVRNTIFVGRADGARDRSSYGVLHTSRCRRWTTEFRPHLFEMTRYATPDPRLSAVVWPFLDSVELAPVFASLVQESGQLGDMTVPRNGAARLGFKTNAYNWLSVFTDEPPAKDQYGARTPQTKIAWLNFATEPMRDLALSCLSGKWAYAWWVIYGDDFDVTKGLLENFPINLQRLESSPQAERLLELSADLQHELPNYTVYKLNAGKLIGNYDLSACRHITNEVDCLLADFWGHTRALTALELLYYQTIRS